GRPSLLLHVPAGDPLRLESNGEEVCRWRGINWKDTPPAVALNHTLTAPHDRKTVELALKRALFGCLSVCAGVNNLYGILGRVYGLLEHLERHGYTFDLQSIPTNAILQKDVCKREKRRVDKLGHDGGPKRRYGRGRRRGRSQTSHRKYDLMDPAAQLREHRANLEELSEKSKKLKNMVMNGEIPALSITHSQYLSSLHDSHLSSKGDIDHLGGHEESSSAHIPSSLIPQTGSSTMPHMASSLPPLPVGAGKRRTFDSSISDMREKKTSAKARDESESEITSVDIGNDTTPLPGHLLHQKHLEQQMGLPSSTPSSSSSSSSSSVTSATSAAEQIGANHTTTTIQGGGISMEGAPLPPHPSSSSFSSSHASKKEEEGEQPAPPSSADHSATADKKKAHESMPSHTLPADSHIIAGDLTTGLSASQLPAISAIHSFFCPAVEKGRLFRTHHYAFCVGNEEILHVLKDFSSFSSSHASKKEEEGEQPAPPSSADHSATADKKKAHESMPSHTLPADSHIIAGDLTTGLSASQLPAISAIHSFFCPAVEKGRLFRTHHYAFCVGNEEILHVLKDLYFSFAPSSHSELASFLWDNIIEPLFRRFDRIISVSEWREASAIISAASNGLGNSLSSRAEMYKYTHVSPFILLCGSKTHTLIRLVYILYSRLRDAYLILHTREREVYLPRTINSGFKTSLVAPGCPHGFQERYKDICSDVSRCRHAFDPKTGKNLIILNEKDGVFATTRKSLTKEENKTLGYNLIPTSFNEPRVQAQLAAVEKKEKEREIEFTNHLRTQSDVASILTATPSETEEGHVVSDSLLPPHRDLLTKKHLKEPRMPLSEFTTLLKSATKDDTKFEGQLVTILGLEAYPFFSVKRVATLLSRAIVNISRLIDPELLDTVAQSEHTDSDLSKTRSVTDEGLDATDKQEAILLRLAHEQHMCKDPLLKRMPLYVDLVPASFDVFVYEAVGNNVVMCSEISPYIRKND
ncbi:hypothetical protein ADUPG1_000310, partial [Aduncisulcus paluster]